MKKLLLTALALIVVAAGAAAVTPTLAQQSKKLRVDKDGMTISPKSAAARNALCKADCTPNNYKSSSGVGVHGIYRSYAEFDPKLQSIEGKKSFAECVKKCSDPLPSVYVQRAIFGMGANWFGNSKESCLNCHAKGH